MPFTNSPTNETYGTHRVQLTREINARDGGQGGKDEDFVNVFVEPVRTRIAGDKREFIVKRAGTTQQIASVASSSLRGMFYWTDQSKLFYAVGTSIFVYDANTASNTELLTVFGTSTGDVGFCTYLYDDNTIVVIATDGTTLVKIDSSNVVTTCVDADLPAPHVPHPVFLDGYLFLVKKNTADIYNSDLNDPMAWTAGNVISAEMDGDHLVRLAKLNNYLVAFGTGTIEYFWDAAVATGSPLQRNDTPIKMNDYLGGWAEYENSVFFIGAGAGGQPDVYVLKDFKIENIGSPTVSRYLSSTTDGPSNWRANIVSVQGHTFYVVNAGTTVTWVYDVDTKLWAKWAYQATATFPVKFTELVKNSTGIKTFFALDNGLSTIYKFDESLYTDNGTNYTCSIITEASDFGTLNRKMMSRLAVIADRPPNDANLVLAWSDDDYQTYSSGANINLNQDLASTYRLGWFRQRNFKLTYTTNQPLRLQELEVDINKGNA